MGIRTVDGELEEDRRSAIHAATLAFVRDPFMRWLYPSPDEYLRHFPEFTRAFAGPAFEADTAWTTDNGGGAAFWFPPGVHPDGDAIESVMKASVDPARLQTMGAVLGKMEEAHPEEPHWYLAVIGVDAAHQGKGFGGQLMAPALERCDADGVIAYLESSNPANISLYERHGFRVLGEIRIDDAPVVTPMLRPARPS